MREWANAESSGMGYEKFGPLWGGSLVKTPSTDDLPTDEPNSIYTRIVVGLWPPCKNQE